MILGPMSAHRVPKILTSTYICTLSPPVKGVARVCCANMPPKQQPPVRRPAQGPAGGKAQGKVAASQTKVLVH